jgi:chromosome segregation ATPase
VDSELGVVGAHKAVAAVSSDLDEFNHHLGSANSEKSEPSSELARLATDLGSMREAVATNLPSTKAELITVQESVQNHQARIELLQGTLTSLQREQLTLHKLLEACNAGLKGIEQLVAAIPSLRTEHASIKKQLAELNARFDAASEVLADLLQSEDLPDDH